MGVASEFADLSDVMTDEQISELSSVYGSVEDIDLFIAGLMERHAGVYKMFLAKLRNPPAKFTCPSGLEVNLTCSFNFA